MKTDTFKTPLPLQTVGHLLGKQKYLSIHHQNASIVGGVFSPNTVGKGVYRKGGRFIGQTPFRMQSVSGI